MINFKTVNKYCCEEISLIENYEKAANDKTQTWHCHHRLESDLGLSIDELIEQNKYYNVPASELIFLTSSEHQKLHRANEKHRGKDAPFYNKHHSEETKKKQSNSTSNRPWMTNGITCVRPKTQEEIEHYRSLGYHRGRK